jgi:hypothetical protein
MGGCLGTPEDDMGYPGESEGPNSGDTGASRRKRRKDRQLDEVQDKRALLNLNVLCK